MIQDRVEYLTDPSVVDEIGRANLDESLFAKVNIFIEDFRSISYLKVKANIEVAGELVTSKSLNVPGQNFLGKVENNLIEGIFEIKHKRYNGDNPPPFPTDFNKNEFLKTYLDPERFIESDDPVLTGKAMNITEDSKDSWKASGRLSRWITKNIRGEVPGGISARDVYRIKKGDCGGNSQPLVAFCRAVGIPARLVTGVYIRPT
jgi:transglutaminase-like putative cysteine protease